ncbi:MAG TPA: hypothetical protein VMZ91_16330 [Candidatus Paceibacterota bacterium]|nr:hypothetical protein [Candidatus Paceibacterota bacterium]
METKHCSRCQKIKIIEKFHKTKTHQDGYSSWCKNCMKRYRKEYYEKNKKITQKYNKKWLKDNKDKRKKYLKTWYKTYKKRRNRLLKEKRKTDIGFKLTHNLRVRLSITLKRNNKSITTKKMIGCSIDYLKRHLKKQFKKGMTWENYGKWHVDHIRPISSFDLSKKDEQRKCFNYKNLQPLWAEENLRKGGKFNVDRKRCDRRCENS